MIKLLDTLLKIDEDSEFLRDKISTRFPGLLFDITEAMDVEEAVSNIPNFRNDSMEKRITFNKGSVDKSDSDLELSENIQNKLNKIY